MKTLTAGDLIYGHSYTDMINKAIGTKFKGYRRSLAELDDFGAAGVGAWFVYMNGMEHGMEDNLWENFKSLDETYIKEFCVSPSHKKIMEKRDKEGFHPFRLAFQIDPYDTDDSPTCCKFLGAFCFSKFLREDLTAIEYKKISDVFRINGKDEFGAPCSTRADLLEIDDPVIKKFLSPIDELRLPEKIYQMLKGAEIKYAGELLELGLGTGSYSTEIRKSLYGFFR